MVHTRMFDMVANEYRTFRLKIKPAYYINRSLEAAGDQGAIFAITDQCLQKNNDAPLPNHDSPELLANSFIQFFPVPYPVEIQP